jgi:hypothetical protein
VEKVLRISEEGIVAFNPDIEVEVERDVLNWCQSDIYLSFGLPDMRSWKTALIGVREVICFEVLVRTTVQSFNFKTAQQVRH